MLKKTSIAILLFNIFTNTQNVSSEINLKHIEVTAALLRTPAVMAKNSQYLKTNSTSFHFLNLSVDILRLINEVLSVVNDDGEFEYHKYDYAWAIYDTASLIAHFKDLFMKSEDTNQNSQEIKKLDGLILEFHKKIFPLAEGLTSFASTIQFGNTVEDAHFRLKCKALNSAIRLLDYIVACKYKSTEQILYAVALVISISVSIKDLYEINNIEDALFKEEEMRKQAEEARLQKIRDDKRAIKKAETARLKKIRDEENARWKAEEERLQKIRDEERARAWAEEKAILAKENMLRKVALSKHADDPSRLAWEDADIKASAVSTLENKLTEINCEIRNLDRKPLAAYTRQNSYSSESWTPLDERLHPPRDSWLGKQFYAKLEEEKIQKRVNFELDRREEEKRLKEQAALSYGLIATLEKSKYYLSSELEIARQAAWDAREYALQVSMDNMA